ncbi:unnamed protein product [Callosobruchus maculatus]|uniref:Uncharacterized protein n=1 Tax=Callosobruchus maculatus TaxID=64391 RepID=A0A653DIT8_CALMS|nr:unnamed protein product [Callosobruchus maculatus]
MMKCCKKSKPPGAYKYKEQDLPEIFRTCRPPPPPPPGEELWELQFCRWWGWNWVKKRDDLGGPGGRPSLENERQNRRQVQQQQYRCNEDPRVMERRPPYNGGNMGARCSPTRCNNDRQMMMNSRPPYGRVERRVEKKHIKQLCNCLCFKKKPQGISSLQNMYSTPSNSVVMHETYTCGVVHNQDSVARLEVERNISRKGRRETCRCKCSQAQPWMNVKEESESSDEGIDCQCCGKANKSSTEDSIEVLNVRIKHILSATDCPCHEH